MSPVGLFHGNLVHPRRVTTLAAHAARLIPQSAHVLDVGTGDGRLAAAIRQRRSDVSIDGIDVLIRPDAAIPVTVFDGHVIPLPNRSRDVVTLFDVLHHAEDPTQLLAEATRVARRCIVLKDHVCSGPMAYLILRFMDEVGNRRHGVALPHHYWNERQWSDAIDRLHLRREVWEVSGLGLYPPPFSLVFGDHLHVLARLGVPEYL
jgi:SAM-dependent methyltransferase